MRFCSTRLVKAAGAGLAGLAVVGVAGASPLGAQESSFQATASADGFRTSFGAPGRFAVGEFADFGSPVAQAVLNSLGESKAFASAPYPGANVIAGPGTLAGFTPLPNPGEYPFYVSSTYPAAPETALNQPGLSLKAASEELSSAAEASHGGGSSENVVGFSAAKSSVRLDGGSVVAESMSAVKAVHLGPLAIGAINAQAKATRGLDGAIKRDSSLDFQAVSIAGQAVGVSTAGLTLAGSALPLPDSSPLLQALDQAGIAVRYVGQLETSDGIVSGGLVVTQTMSPPDGGPPAIVQLSFGRAVARVTGEPAPADGGSEKVQASSVGLLGLIRRGWA